MKIGQISFFRMSSPVDRPYGSPELGSKYQGQSEPTALGVPPRLHERPWGRGGLRQAGARGGEPAARLG
jgi:dCTP deaminase